MTTVTFDAKTFDSYFGVPDIWRQTFDTRHLTPIWIDLKIETNCHTFIFTWSLKEFCSKIHFLWLEMMSSLDLLYPHVPMCSVEFSYFLHLFLVAIKIHLLNCIHKVKFESKTTNSSLDLLYTHVSMCSVEFSYFLHLFLVARPGIKIHLTNCIHKFQFTSKTSNSCLDLLHTHVSMCSVEFFYFIHLFLVARPAIKVHLFNCINKVKFKSKT